MLVQLELSDADIDRIAKRSAHFVLQELAAKDGKRAHRGERPSGVSVKEAARRTGVSQKNVRRLISKGELPAKKLGARLVIPESALAALLGEGE